MNFRFPASVQTHSQHVFDGPGNQPRYFPPANWRRRPCRPTLRPRRKHHEAIGNAEHIRHAMADEHDRDGPRSRSCRIRLRTSATCRTEMAAVGSSIRNDFWRRQSGFGQWLLPVAVRRTSGLTRSRGRVFGSQLGEDLSGPTIHRGIVENF